MKVSSISSLNVVLFLSNIFKKSLWEKDDNMVVSSCVTEAVAKVAFETEVFYWRYIFFFFDGRKRSIIIDVIGGSNGTFICILWWVGKLDCRKCCFFLKSSIVCY